MTCYKKYFPNRAKIFSSLNKSLFDSSFKLLFFSPPHINSGFYTRNDFIQTSILLNMVWEKVDKNTCWNKNWKKKKKEWKWSMSKLFFSFDIQPLIFYSFANTFVWYKPSESFCIHHVSVLGFFFFTSLFSKTGTDKIDLFDFIQLFEDLVKSIRSYSLFFLFSGESFNRSVQQLQGNLYNRWHSLILKILHRL